jgi:hypothetical protein
MTKSFMDYFLLDFCTALSCLTDNALAAIAVLPPDIGIGRAIRNRLIRASGDKN